MFVLLLYVIVVFICIIISKGTIAFIGELFMRHMLSYTVMRSCVSLLFGTAQHSNAKDIEVCMCVVCVGMCVYMYVFDNYTSNTTISFLGLCMYVCMYLPISLALTLSRALSPFRSISFSLSVSLSLAHTH